MFPLIPLLAVIALAGGGGALCWYSNLSAQEKREADALANKLAWDLFDARLDELTSHQVNRIQTLVKAHFLN